MPALNDGPRQLLREAEPSSRTFAPEPPDARPQNTGNARTQRPSRGDGVRPALPGWLSRCKLRDAAKDHPNGELPGGELCDLPVGDHLLHPDAARDWWRLNRSFRARFAQNLCLTDSYRSYEAQSQVYATKPGLAATPGTSRHGWGVAVDLCGGIEDFGSPAHQWLREHGPAYGWDNPPWARADGDKPEPWHWEYTMRSINDGGRKTVDKNR